MSSLHHDHLLVEGPEPVKGTGSTLGTARGISRKPVEEKATNTVPTQRQGKPQRTGSTPTTTDAPRTRRTAGSRTAAAAAAAGSITARAKAASARAATAKAATVKAASAKAATARSATTRAVTTAKAAAAAKAAARATGARPVTALGTPAVAEPPVAVAGPPVAVAEPTVAVEATATTAAAATPSSPEPKPAAEPAVAKPAAAEATTRAATAVVRPTPYKRSAEPLATAVPTVAEPVEVTAPAPTSEVTAPEVTASEITASEVTASRGEAPRSRFLHHRPPSVGRRPALYLAAALAGALSISAFSAGDPAAQATSSVSHSVSVAQELGIEAAPAVEISEMDATQRLGELAVSRNARDADQAAAAQAQAKADRAAAAAAAAAAAEAARPKAVLPVNGARLTSGFGARWGTLHAGIDLAAPMRTPEYAAMDGVVLEAGPASGYGLAVYIQHENGDVTVYGHMDSILVQAGQVVRAGETIALLGNRGQSTGPHLHFEVHVGGLDGQKIDPIPWLRERGVAI